MQLTQFSERQAINTGLDIVAATGTAYVNLWSAVLSDARLDSLFASNDDVIDHRVDVQVSAFLYGLAYLGSVNVPAGAGHTTGPSIDLLAALDPRQPYLALAPSDALQLRVQVAVTAAFAVSIAARGGLL
jgi:hypothetical protein